MRSCRKPWGSRWSPLAACAVAALALAAVEVRAQQPGTAELAAQFARPPAAARPWVYWFWMDGNLSREGITADLEAMRRAGVGGMIVMEVDVGIPKGPVRFMSPPWRELFRHAAREAERLGLEITLNAGPGWTGSGGPWVRPEQSMQHIVAGAVEVVGPARFSGVAPRGARRPAYFGEAGLPAALRKSLDDFYADVALLAFPSPSGEARIADIDEKALYVRHPYSSMPGTRPYLPAPAVFPALPAGAAVARGRVLDLTASLQPDGRLEWQVPEGRWTLLRLGRTSTGANTRPSPEPGIGLECDKFDRAALEAHFEAFVGSLLDELGPRTGVPASGWTTLHIDSWEMGSQNWSAHFREEFQKRRGYGPLPFLPAVTGRVVDSLEVSERFLWDFRQTAQELVVENHARHLRELGRRRGFRLSIEPYDMNPCSDMTLGAAADVPMGEFWAAGYGFQTAFSCIEAVSIAHTNGRPVVAAESFTADAPEAWRLHPAAMKAQADWAFATGINRLVIHRYAHQPWLDRRPGMTMGPYGVHYERTQTWWDMAGAWHAYLARCQHLLRQGTPVADICYLVPEGAPHVFRPPHSALSGSRTMPDRRSYALDGCAPELVRDEMRVEGGRLTLPGGASYRLLVLPEVETMTPPLLRKVRDLIAAGATVLGPRPVRSPGLSGWPQCDDEVRRLADELWGPAAGRDPRTIGQGRPVPSPRAADSRTTDPPMPAAARWIWHPEGDFAAAAPGITRWFRREFELEEAKIESARVTITADNTFSVQVNGQPAGEGDNFTLLYAFDIKPLLKPGKNVLLVAAGNAGEAPNPAGLIGAVEVRLAGGRRIEVATGGAWQSAAAQGGPWKPAKELGAFGMAPWGKAGRPADYPPLYGDYAQAAGVLARLGVPPDFESDAPLRYAHRRLNDGDLYFVANPAGAPVEARCGFRVTGRRPSLWDPATGEIFAVGPFEENDGRTWLRLPLEEHDSVFVVFHAGPLPPSARGTPRRPALCREMELAGPWEVRFPAGHGAPGQVRLDALADLAEHSDAGVRHFSGTAIYRKVFHLPVALPDVGRQLFLDLGKVQVMARARLNGQDLGVAWKPPFRLSLAQAARSGENVLEVEVANLWPNRLIGDQSLPPEKRIARTTWNPYRAGDKLFPSGLLGPVVVQSAAEDRRANGPNGSGP